MSVEVLVGTMRSGGTSQRGVCAEPSQHALRPDFLGESAPRAAQTRVSDGPARADIHLERGASTCVVEIETTRENDIGRTRRGELDAHGLGGITDGHGQRASS